MLVAYLRAQGFRPSSDHSCRRRQCPPTRQRHPLPPPRRCTNSQASVPVDRCRQSLVAPRAARGWTTRWWSVVRDVAAKYRGKDVESTLVEKVRLGGSGVWGQTPMIPNPQVPEQDLHAIVKWILALK
jgi:hypothetical protein